MFPLVILAGAIEVSTAIPYIIDIRKGKTRPAIVSWSTWLLLSAIAAAASFAEGATASGVIASALVVECFMIILFSLRKGHFSYTRFDGFCQLGALLGIMAWYVTSDPLAAIITFVITDLIGAFPTFRHSWRRPLEETVYTFTLSILGNGLALATIPDHSLVTTLVPLYLLTLNTALSGTIFLRRKRGIESI